MNILTKTVTSLTRLCFQKSVEAQSSVLTRYSQFNNTGGTLVEAARKCFENSIQGLQQIRAVSLLRMHKTGPLIKKRPNKNPFGYNKPFAKGVVLKTLVKKPKKPNSANRKCVLVRLSTGKEMTAYIPGVGHNLQEHNIVLCRVGRCKDVPGIKIKCVRGKYDLAHVSKVK